MSLLGSILSEEEGEGNGFVLFCRWESVKRHLESVKDSGFDKYKAILEFVTRMDIKGSYKLVFLGSRIENRDGLWLGAERFNAIRFPGILPHTSSWSVGDFECTDSEVS